MKKDLILLTVSQLLSDLGSSPLGIFGIIFFYTKLGNSLILTALPFVLAHILYSIMLPPLTKYCIKLGIKGSIALSILFFIASSFVVYFSSDNLNAINLILFAIFSALGHTFYYVPIIYILGNNTTHNNRGRIFGLRRVLSIISNILLPVFAGFISQFFGLQGLMIASIAFFILSLIPILRMSNMEIVQNTPLKKIIKTKAAKKILIFKFSQVMINDLNNYWPIFVFFLLGSSYSNVGILFASVCFISIIISFGIGNLMDKDGRQKYLKIAAITTPISWLIRSLSVGYSSLIIADSIFSVNGSFYGSVMDVIDYDLMNDRESQEKRVGLIVFSETILNYAIGFGYLFFAILLTILGFYATFAFVAFLSLILMQIIRIRLNSESI